MSKQTETRVCLPWWAGYGAFLRFNWQLGYPYYHWDGCLKTRHNSNLRSKIPFPPQQCTIGNPHNSNKKMARKKIISNWAADTILRKNNTVKSFSNHHLFSTMREMHSSDPAKLLEIGPNKFWIVRDGVQFGKMNCESPRCPFCSQPA